MTTEEITSYLEEIKPRYAPTGDIKLVSISDNKVVLSVSGLPQDIFKVQGKIINSGEEIKEEIAKKISEKFSNSNIVFE